MWFYLIHSGYWCLLCGRMGSQLLHGTHKWAFMCLASIPSAYSPGRELSVHLTFLDHFTYPQKKSAHSLLILDFSNLEGFPLDQVLQDVSSLGGVVPPDLSSYILTHHMVGGLAGFLHHPLLTLSPFCGSLFLLNYTQSTAI